MKLFQKKQKTTSRRQPYNADDARPGQVFSYYSSRSNSAVPTGRFIVPEKFFQGILRRLRKRHIPTVLATLAIAVSLGYVLSLNSSPRIVLVAASPGNQLLRSSAIYQQAAQKLFEQSLLNHTKLTVNNEAITASMKRQFPELDTATIILPLAGRRPVLNLSAVTPALVLNTQSGLFVLDASGKAVMSAPDIPDFKALNVPIVTDQNQIPVTLGGVALPAQDVAFITMIAAQLRAQHLAIESLTLPPLPEELHLKLAGQRYYIKLDMRTDPRLAIGTYLAVKQKLEADHITPAEYVDVRVPERAYFR